MVPDLLLLAAEETPRDSGPEQRINFESYFELRNWKVYDESGTFVSSYNAAKK